MAVSSNVSASQPTAKETEEGLRIVQDRLTYWQSVGAQSSPTVDRLINKLPRRLLKVPEGRVPWVFQRIPPFFV